MLNFSLIISKSATAKRKVQDRISSTAQVTDVTDAVVPAQPYQLVADREDGKQERRHRNEVDDDDLLRIEQRKQNRRRHHTAARAKRAELLNNVASLWRRRSQRREVIRHQHMTQRSTQTALTETTMTKITTKAVNLSYHGVDEEESLHAKSPNDVAADEPQCEHVSEQMHWRLLRIRRREQRMNAARAHGVVTDDKVLLHESQHPDVVILPKHENHQIHSDYRINDAVRVLLLFIVIVVSGVASSLTAVAAVVRCWLCDEKVPKRRGR